MRSLVLATLLANAPATDERPTAEIRWEAPPECGSVDALETRVEALASTGGDVWREAHASARVELRDGLYRAQVELHTAEGDSHHEFEAGTCAEIVEVVALETAMMLDAVQTMTQVEVSPAPPTPPAEPERPRPGVSGRILMLGGASFGQPDRVAGAFRLGAAMDVALVRFVLSAHVSTPERVSHADFPDEGATVLVVGGAVDTCFVPGKGRLWVPLCVGLEGGTFRARGFGVDDPRTSYRPYLAPRVGTGMEVLLGRHVSLAFAATTPLVALRPVFDIGGLGELYRAPIASFRLLAGVHVRWGT